jgi:4-carboxymuconolactone decarboxylase
MLRSPGMAEGMMNLYNYYRWKTVLPLPLMEFAVLITSREWNSPYEWLIHYPLAVKAGMSPAVLADLRVGKRPSGMKPEEAAEYDFATELLRKHAVSDATFQKAKTLLSEKGVVDLTGLLGAYAAFAGMLNVAEVKVDYKDAPEHLPIGQR